MRGKITAAAMAIAVVAVLSIGGCHAAVCAFLGAQGEGGAYSCN